MPIGDILKSLLKPLPTLRQPAKVVHRDAKPTKASPAQETTKKIKAVEEITEIFREPVEIDFRSHNGMESLIANPQPPAPGMKGKTAVQLTVSQSVGTSLTDSDIEREYIKGLPVRIMVQSPQDDHSKYRIVDEQQEGEEVEDYEDDAFVDDAVAEASRETTKGSDKQSALSAPNVDPDSGDNFESSWENRGTLREATTTTTRRPEISTTTQLLTTTTMVATTTPPERQVTKPKKVKQVRKEKRKDGPSLDKIAERVFERYKNHEEIPSYEDMWYDDNGEKLWSQENTAKNVKRQVDHSGIVRPVPRQRVGSQQDDLQKINDVTETIDRFRVMLDLAQQVEFYLTKRLQAGINALSAIYEDQPARR